MGRCETVIGQLVIGNWTTRGLVISRNGQLANDAANSST